MPSNVSYWVNRIHFPAPSTPLALSVNRRVRERHNGQLLRLFPSSDRFTLCSDFNHHVNPIRLNRWFTPRITMIVSSRFTSELRLHSHLYSRSKLAFTILSRTFVLFVKVAVSSNHRFLHVYDRNLTNPSQRQPVLA